MSQSSMENLKGFEERIRRIEGGSRKAGRVGYKRSGEYFRKEEERKRQRRKGRKANWTFRIVLVLACVLGVKTYIMVKMGPEAYDARMAELEAGGKYDKMAFAVMQPDPVTGKLQELLSEYGILTPKPDAREAASPPVVEAQAEPEKQEAGSSDGEPASGSSSVDGVSN